MSAPIRRRLLLLRHSLSFLRCAHTSREVRTLHICEGGGRLGTSSSMYQGKVDRYPARHPSTVTRFTKKNYAKSSKISLTISCAFLTSGSKLDPCTPPCKYLDILTVPPHPPLLLSSPFSAPMPCRSRDAASRVVQPATETTQVLPLPSSTLRPLTFPYFLIGRMPSFA